MNNIVDNINEVLAQWADGVIKKIQGNLESTGTNASGRTSSSLEYTVEGGELTIYGRKYFQGVEQGRPGGKIPANFTDIIRQWATDKGIITQFGSTEREQRSVSAAIAWFIRKNGTSLYRKGGRTDIFSNVLDEELPKLEEKLSLKVVEGLLTDK